MSNVPPGSDPTGPVVGGPPSGPAPVPGPGYGAPPPGPPGGGGGGPTGDYTPPPGENWMGRNRNTLLIILGVLLVGALIGTLVVVLTGDDAAADEVFLEPAESEGTDPFTDDTTDVTVGALAGEVTGSQNGSEPGLYGGTRDDSSCNRLALVRFLNDDPAKAAAWASVHGIDPDEIFDYVAGLTPVLLRGDTRVTNHGFRDGTANPIQSVLQAGTAVLVDDQGIPRVRCSCGNPLLAPVEASSPRYVGPEWSGFDRNRTQVIFVDVDIDIFILTDVETGERFSRPAGTDGNEDEDEDGPPPTTSSTTSTTSTSTPSSTTTTTTTTPTTTTESSSGLGTGDVQATISWSGDHDVDLHVIDPNGEEISFSNTSSSSGGQLDVDDIPTCGDQGSNVENVFWPTGSAPSGSYQVFANNLGGCSGSTPTVSVQVLVNGSTVVSDSSSVPSGSSTQTYSFSV